MIPFAYIVRMSYSFLLFLVILVFVRFLQVLNAGDWLIYPTCSLIAIVCVTFYYLRMEASFNYIITKVNFSVTRPISLILRSLDFLFYSFFKLGWRGLAFFCAITVLPTLILAIRNMTRLYASRPTLIHANITVIVLGFILGYIIRKNLVNNIVKDYLRVINRVDWYRALTLTFITLATLLISMYNQLLPGLVFGVCAGTAFDFALWLRQTSNTYHIRRGLLAFTYVKKTPNIPADFVKFLLLGRPSKLRRIIEGQRNARGPKRDYFLMRCCYYFFRKEFHKLNKLYTEELPDDLKDDPWFKHLMSGIHFSTGDLDKGIEELSKILEDLDPNHPDDKKLIPHVMVNLAAFHDFAYSFSGGKRDIERAIDLCREAVHLDSTCSYSLICLAYYVARSVDTFENGKNKEEFELCLEYLHRALYEFSSSENFPWLDSSKQYILFSNIFYTAVRGYIYMKRGIYKYARDDYAYCLLMDPLYARAHFHLAELFEKIALVGGKREDTVFQYLKVMHVLPQTTSVLALFKLAKQRLEIYLKESEIGIFYADPRKI